MNTPKLRFEGFEEDWKISKLSNFLNHIGSGVTPRGGSSVYQTEGILLIRSQNVHFAGLKLKDVAYISDEINAKMKNSQLSDSDVLLNITGASIGRVTIVPLDFPKANVNQHVCILRANEYLLPYFLKTYLESDYGQKNVFKDQAGQTREALNLEQIKSFNIGIPCIEEQKKMTEFFSLITQRINLQQEKIKDLEELKKGMMQKIFSQKLRFKDEDEREFPKWEKAYLNNLGTFGKSYSYSRAVEGDGIYRYIHYGDIHSNYPSVCENVEFPTITNVQQYELLIDNDIVFADASEDYADLGKAILIKKVNEQQVIAGLHTHKFTPNQRLNSLYFIYFTQTRVYEEFIKRMGTGVSVLGISKTNLNKLEVLLPSVQEQEKIGRIIYSLDQKIQREKDKTKILTSHKQGFMQQMFI
ncbi:restriction endonuclease subunit S [Paenisporosarcina sp.]|uniref:restriction endonuclease subunit S n=1 Tax=Paenisporosarcina sp. TaxID=1932001 RepID=UPI003C770E3E